MNFVVLVDMIEIVRSQKIRICVTMCKKLYNLPCFSQCFTQPPAAAKSSPGRVRPTNTAAPAQFPLKEFKMKWEISVFQVLFDFIFTKNPPSEKVEFSPIVLHDGQRAPD